MTTTCILRNTLSMAAADPPERPALTPARFEAVYDEHIDFVWRDELDDERRELFVLAELEQLTLREIAEVLGERPGTIASRLRAPRAAFEDAAKRRRIRGERRLPWTA
jgi:hypothetical protein